MTGTFALLPEMSLLSLATFCQPLLIAIGQMNPPLSEDGVLQAASISDRLKNEQFDYIYCSDLIRATQVIHKTIFRAIGAAPGGGGGGEENCPPPHDFFFVASQQRGQSCYVC